MDKSELELLLNLLVLYLIQDHLIYGFLQKNADFHLLATFTNTSIAIKVLLTLKMELNLISLMDQVLLLDSLDKIL